MKNNSYDLENHEFIQEVDEYDINPDLSYKNKAKKYIIILIILSLFSFISIFVGFYLYLNNEKKVEEEPVSATIADLFVVHSKTEFGDTVKSFDSYTSVGSSHNYSFYINNNTGFDINYSILLEDVDFKTASNLCDKSKVNYELFKNNISVSAGLLKDQDLVSLLKTKILSGSSDNYILKLWSSQGCDGYLKYKINVSE